MSETLKGDYINGKSEAEVLSKKLGFVGWPDIFPTTGTDTIMGLP
jgi:hypothetical protein